MQLLEQIDDRNRHGLRFDRARFEATDVEQRVQEPRHRIDRVLLLGEQRTNIGCGHDFEHRGVEQPDRLERLAQIVARGGEKAALRAIGSIRLLARGDERLVDALSFRDVPNRGRDIERIPDSKRRKPNAGRKLGAIDAPRRQIRKPRSHLPLRWLEQEARDMLLVSRSQPLRNEHGHVLPDQRRRFIPEQLRDSLACKADFAPIVDDDQRVRRRAQQVPGDLAQLIHRKAVSISTAGCGRCQRLAWPPPCSVQRST